MSKQEKRALMITEGTSACDRSDAVRRGITLSYVTIGYNSLEAIGSLAAGVLSGSVALVGFGVDSVIEVASSCAAQWRLRTDVDEEKREGKET